MPVKPQILAAISGALGAYLQEEEAWCAAAMAQAAPAALPGVNLWAASGRQWTMQVRQLMQRRALR